MMENQNFVYERKTVAYGKKVKLWREPNEDGVFEELTEKQIQRIKDRAMNYCMWSLGNTAKTRKQLADKMREKNCPDDIAEFTLNRLEEMHLLNDNDYAESFVRSRQYARKGKRKIAQDLRMRGIDPDIIETVLEDTDEEDETERARELIAKKLPGTRHLERQKRVNRLVSNLVRNGYGMGVAFSVVNDALNNEELDEDENEEDE